MSVFTEGPTALIVSSALDPDVTLDRFAQKGFHPKLWVAKLTGEDTGAEYDIRHAFDRARARGLRVGGWVQLTWSPQRDIASLDPWFDKEDLDVLELAAEVEYKGNYEQGDVYRADGIVAAVHDYAPPEIPKAVISYGRRDYAMRVEVFKQAGWHVVPECYDAFAPVDDAQLAAFADTYYPLFAGREIHPLVRTWAPLRYRGNRAGIYRPEGLL